VGSEENDVMVDLVSVCIDDLKGNMHDACNPANNDGTEITCGPKFVFNTTTTTTTKSPGGSGGSGLVFSCSVLFAAVFSLIANYMKH